MADIKLDPDLLNKLRVVDLREHLATRGLGTSGLKADLVKRLREALLSESQQQDDGSETVGNAIIEEDPQTFSNEQSGSGNDDEDAITETENVVNYSESSSNLTAKQSEQQILEDKYKQHVLAEQQRLAAEEEQKRAEEDRRKAEEEQLRVEEEQRAEEEKRCAEEKQRLAEEEQRRAEEEQRCAEEEQRHAEEEQRRVEEEQRRAVEEQRLAEEEQRRAKEEQRRAQLEQRRKEELQIIEEEQRRAVEQRRIEEEQKRAVELQRIEEEQRRAEELQKIEEEQRRAEELQRIEEEQRRAEELQRIEEEQRRAEELQRIEKERRAEEKRKWLEEEQEKQAEEERRQRVVEEQRRKVEEEHRKKLEEERKQKAEEQKKKEEEKIRRAEEQRRRIEIEMRRKEEEERLRKAEEDHKKKIEEERIKRIMEERNRLADEEQKRMVEEQESQLRWAQHQQRQFADEQHQHKINEQQRLLAEQEEHKMLLAEKQHRLLENEQKMADDHKKAMAEQQQILLEQQKQRADEESMISAQQKLIAEEMLKEQEELLKLQQQAVKEKEEEQRIQQQMASHSITSGPPPVPGVLLSHTQISSGTTFSHSLSAPPPPIQSPQIHMTAVPPPSPTILMPVPPGLSGPVNSSMNIMTQCPPPNVPGMTLAAPPPPRFSQPPPPATTAGLISSSNLHSMNMTLTAQLNQSSHLPLLSHLSMGDSDITAPGTSEDMDSIPEDAASDIKLPQALEKVLALKTERAQLLGVDPDSVVQPMPVAEEKETSLTSKQSVVTLVNVDEDEGMEEESSSKSKESKGRRRKKKKKKQQAKFLQKENTEMKKKSEPTKETSVDIDIEYVQDVLDISDPLYSHFVKIFEKFKLNEADKEKEAQLAEAGKAVPKEENINPMALRKKPMDIDDDDDDDEKDDDKKDDDKPKLSKRKLKKLSRMSVAELKQKVNRPELVEMHDVTAKDPILLLHLKASRNTVPVPRHWCFKRKYLQGKRGIEKPAFELPDFIKKTGIMEMRQALQEKEDQKTMKAKMRERVRPKMGKIDIDYQKLHDAFFKWQTKPRMTIHGDLYYEGKEFETRLKEKKPGDLSEDLRTALGMPTGPNANKCPPPWLIAMQRYGPPPSYPNLKIPGLNAPIPDSCSFGYHAGGWGKPPVDETGRPLYGDVFGTQMAENQPQIHEEEIDHTLWGELESESSEEEEEEEDEDEEDEEEKVEDETGLVTPAEGLITPSGFSSIPAGMETPDMIELRKRKIEAEMEGGETPALYTILPEKKTERIGAAMMGSTHIYDLAGAIPAGKIKLPGSASVPPQGIEVALDPSELELDSAAMAARYEQTMREQQSQLEKEDLSDMVAEHAARQKNKRKKQQMDSAKPPKKYKEFKF